MSEREPLYESGKSPELDTKQLEKLAEENHERLREAAEKAGEQDPGQLEEIHKRIEKAAKSKEQINAENAVEDKAKETPIPGLGSNMKQHAYKRRLHSIQRQESRTDRAFSKVIHNPVIESISDAAENTVARPSGLLAAGIFAALSGIAVLYICKHYGYEYNFTISLAAMAGGFVVGIILEGAWKLLRRSK